MAGPIRDRVRQRFASPLFRPTCSADIAQRRGLAALSAALPEAKRLSAQQGRCCYFARAPTPSFPQSLAEGSPGRAQPILFVIAFDRRRRIVRLVLLATRACVGGHLASVSVYARATCTTIADSAVNSGHSPLFLCGSAWRQTQACYPHETCRLQRLITTTFYT